MKKEHCSNCGNELKIKYDSDNTELTFYPCENCFSDVLQEMPNLEIIIG
jgi:hypothetical protein